MSDVAQKIVGVGLVVVGIAMGYPYLVAAGSVIYGAASQRQAKRSAEDAAAKAKAASEVAFLAGLKDRTATSVGTEQYHRTLYGINKVGGNIVAMLTSGPHDEFKHCVVIFANHQINAYSKFWVAGKYVGNLDGSGWVQDGAFFDATTGSDSWTFTTSIVLPNSYVPGSVYVYYAGTSNPIAYTLSGSTLTVATGVSATVSFQYASGATGGAQQSRLNIQTHLGIPNESADSFLVSRASSQWTGQHTLEGHAYCVFTLDLRQAEFQGGPPSFEAEVQGKKLYDPRTGTTYYSDNNALVLYDYLTGPYMKVPSSALPISDYIAAANDCDDIVRSEAVYPQSNKRYTLNGLVLSNQSPKTVLEQIAMSMAGTVDGNSWSVYAGKYRAPVMTLFQDDVVGDISVVPGLGYQGTYNTVRGQYVSPATDYVATDYPPYINAAYKVSDGEEIVTDSQAPFTNNVTGVYALARIHMEDSRSGFLISGDFSYKTWALRPGDRVLFNFPVLGISSKVFRVTDKSVKFGSPVKLTLKEDSPQIWDQVDAAIADETPNTALPDPYAVPLLPALAATSGTATLLKTSAGTIMSRILLTWQPANYRGSALVDVQWRRHISTVWETLATSVDNPATYLPNVLDGEPYTIRARLRSVNLNAVGNWSYVDHKVVGKEELPPDVVSLTANDRVFTWPAVDVPDLAGYVLAFNYGTSTDWGTASPLNTGLVTESPYRLASSVHGLVTVLIKAVDTSGNLSKNAANAYVVLDAPTLANILQTTDYGAASYPGVVAGGVLFGATLIANATDSFYGVDDSSFYGPADSDSLYTSATSSYGELVYITSELYISSALPGSKLSIAMSLANSPTYTLEYKAPDLTSFYDLDGNSFYGMDGDPFYTDSAVVWLPWPGQVIAKNIPYQFRLTLLPNASAQPTVQSFIVILDAPDLVETLSDLTITSAGTPIPYTLPFTVIKNIQATLNANVVGGVTTEVDKTTLTVKVYNSSHTAVSGATVDLLLRGY